MTGRLRVALTGVGVLNGVVEGASAALGAWLSDGPAGGGERAGAAEREAAARAVPPARLAALIDADEARRMSRACQLTVAAARLALTDAGLPAGVRLGLVIGTEFGDLRSTMEFADGFLSRGPTGLSPLLFPNTVMNTMASATAIAVQARESSLTLAVPTVAGELAVARAASAIAAGRLEAVLAGGVDQADRTVRAAARQVTGATDAWGEGAAFVVLEPLAAAVARGARVLGEIRGAAWRALPARPCGVGRAADPRAIDEALDSAGLGAADIGWLYTSASGDEARDAWERAVVGARFAGERASAGSLARVLGRHSGVGALHVAAAAWTARSGILAGTRSGDGGRSAPARVGRGPGLVHGLARGGTHVVLAVDGAE
jgi:3-oxoacyl-[acyl-carrier-protein] synthase II